MESQRPASAFPEVQHKSNLFSFGGGLMCVGLSVVFAEASPLRVSLATGFFLVGLLLILRGWSGRVFRKRIPMRLKVEGIRIDLVPPASHESPLRWACFVFCCFFLAFLSGHFYGQYFPVQPQPYDKLFGEMSNGFSSLSGKVAQLVQRPDPASKLSGPNPRLATPKPGVTIIATSPSIGNLSERAIALSDAIMTHPCEHGWKRDGCPLSTQLIAPMPETPHELNEWNDNEQDYFRFRFLASVRNIRDEFSQFHIVDSQLNDYIDEDFAQYYPIEIETISERLRVLGGEIKQRKPPKPLLLFSVSHVSSGTASNNILTIPTDPPIPPGYIVVQVDRWLRSYGTDTGNANVERADYEGNKPLRDYVSSLLAMETVVVKLRGDDGFVAKRPIHIYLQTDDGQIRVTKVTWFDE